MPHPPLSRTEASELPIRVGPGGVRLGFGLAFLDLLLVAQRAIERDERKREENQADRTGEYREEPIVDLDVPSQVLLAHRSEDQGKQNRRK